MVLVVFLTWFLGANKAIGVPLVWISNPITIPPIFYGGYTMGRMVLGREPLDQAWWAALAAPPEGWWDATWFYWSRTVEIAWPLWVGCVVLGALASIPTYYFVFSAVSRHRAPGRCSQSAS
jgi:uncharacterized protein (DUF2062 family)